MMDSVAIFVRSIASGMHAALLLARGRPEGLQYADSDLAGAARSFWAIAVALPAFILLRQLGGNAGATPAHDFALDLLSYIIGATLSNSDDVPLKSGTCNITPT